MGLSPLTRSVTVILERHLLSLSNRDFAARAHTTLTDFSEDPVMKENPSGLQRSHDHTPFVG